MATALLPAPPAPHQIASIRPHPLRWTCDEFYSLNGVPAFAARKLILIDGEILEMASPGPLHVSTQTLVEDWLRTVFSSPQYWVRGQVGMRFGINTDPLPDVAVIEGTPRTVKRHPSTALLVIEISDTSLVYDLGEKASLYAAAGIADYWVIDVVNARLHVFRQPVPDAARAYGHWYGQVQVLSPTDTIAPLASPQSAMSVSALLP